MPIDLKIVSWNIKDFGTYDYATTFWVMAELIRDADIIIILEIACNRGTKTMKIGSGGIRTNAYNAVEDLRSKLEKNDPNVDWSGLISGVNAGSQKRDAYAFLWKGEPVKTIFPSSSGNLATKISVPSDDIQILDDSHTSTPFPDRRPGLCQFQIMDKHKNTYNLPLVGFHASVPVNGPRAIKSMNALGNSNTIMSTSDIIIGGDFNMDFNSQITFYDSFVKTFKLNVALGNVGTPGSGVKTSLTSVWSGSSYFSSAYDNFFWKGSSFKVGPSGVIDFIAAYGDKTYPGNPSRYYLAWKKLYPKHQAKALFGSHSKVPDAISDHLPVYLTVQIT